ncbi:UDP-2,4-diacetamido-2,4,6-trideoxy-beta-L-altropyranose hydrolase [Paenibacillus eucommiae]|uniref:UDP-2,4-diacetamido-2,4, 6-trideoxy-beta-L-altropyranose hydrolase n=1 Tax=Paenibacillus eucommiae TaxID=1355755 RepID=A0ABS4J4E7_9BACL|nr:UDP-2,4-diacetamido-2,4,6-trideoxy-beta-L-altropyranose hydrolase [Paenibacillus eucommiae]MBP1993971.1 UDP-2,4-diacetamido-2,4,6-trideoxy-beta-L-altropyranose hydrolase [Paenibacillus eucommiae]
MLVYFRADASLQIGSGHIMRCLSLAEQLRKQGADVLFLCRDLEGNLAVYLTGKGYHVVMLPAQNESGTKAENLGSDINPAERFYTGSPPHESWLGVPWSVDRDQTIVRLQEETRKVDWFIIDHYALDAKYEQAIRPYIGKLMVIDDLADRDHACDLLLDHNYYADMGSRYEGWLPGSCRTLLGPSYALLRLEFREAKASAVRRDGQVRNILLSFGGVDLTNETLKALYALQPLVRHDMQIEVILGKLNPHAEAVAELCQQIPGCRVYVNVDNMTEFMAGVDLAIGAGGTTTWERCCLGLPSVIITTAGNQERLTEHIARTDAICYLGKSDEVTPPQIREAVERIMRSPQAYLHMSACAAALVDGLGTERVVKVLKELREGLGV